MEKDNLLVRIRDRDRIVYEGKAVSVTSFNGKGRFDILPSHSQYITLIEQMVILQNMDNSESQFPLSGGVMRVFHNNVHIFLGLKKQ